MERPDVARVSGASTAAASEVASREKWWVTGEGRLAVSGLPPTDMSQTAKVEM